MRPPHRYSPFSTFCFLLIAALIASCAPSLTPTATYDSVPPTLTVAAGPSATPDGVTSTPIIPASTAGQGLFILSLNDDDGYVHLFAFYPQTLAFIRLTDGAWNDTQPSLSIDGTKIAFASDRNNYWDIYILDLKTGETTRFTDTPQYDSAPSFSPDDQWMVYETYTDNNLELEVRSRVDPTQDPLRLTNDPAADQNPVWSPQGRQVAFISNRSGENEVWIANLDDPSAGRFINVSKNPDGAESHPMWSFDGNLLAWSSQNYHDGTSSIYLWDVRTPDRPARWVGNGNWPAWSADASQIAALVTAPNKNYLTTYTPSGQLTLPLVALPGNLHGMIWSDLSLPRPLPNKLEAAAQVHHDPLYTELMSIPPDLSGRVALIPLNDVEAPYPNLNDAVNEAFDALRARVLSESNWDTLANLENAYVPLTTYLDPGQAGDWLYTGRSFALNSLLINAGWMIVVREDFGQQTYWRVYVRAQAQDGSRGEPLHEVPWDLGARYSLNPTAYEAGGKLMDQIPPGYWIDLTDLAQSYGFERLPAFSNWRTYFKGARFNQFVKTDGLDWQAAMLQIYPPEILKTPSPFPTNTFTPSVTPKKFKTPTPTITRTPTRTPTLNPTFTPYRSPTPTVPSPTPTNTATITKTPSPTSTPTSTPTITSTPTVTPTATPTP